MKLSAQVRSIKAASNRSPSSWTNISTRFVATSSVTRSARAWSIAPKRGAIPVCGNGTTNGPTCPSTRGLCRGPSSGWSTSIPCKPKRNRRRCELASRAAFRSAIQRGDARRLCSLDFRRREDYEAGRREWVSPTGSGTFCHWRGCPEWRIASGKRSPTPSTLRRRRSGQ